MSFLPTDGSEDSLESLPKEAVPRKKVSRPRQPQVLELDREWMGKQAGTDPTHWDLPLGSELKPQKKKRAYKKDKGEKLNVTGSIKKKGRKPKTSKLESTGDYMNPGGSHGVEGIPPQQEWHGYPFLGVEGERQEVSERPSIPVLQSPHDSNVKPGFDLMPQVLLV